jgi:hypothetical protein
MMYPAGVPNLNEKYFMGYTRMAAVNPFRVNSTCAVRHIEIYTLILFRLKARNESSFESRKPAINPPRVYITCNTFILSAHPITQSILH